MLNEIRVLARQREYVPASPSVIKWAEKFNGLRSWLVSMGAHNIEIKWSAEFLTLYGGAEIEVRQNGYMSDGWNPDWVVIGDIFSNPIILDCANGELLFAKHGRGAWLPIKIAEHFDDFLVFLKVWCEVYYVDFKENILDEEYEVLDGFLDSLFIKLKKLMARCDQKNILDAING